VTIEKDGICAGVASASDGVSEMRTSAHIKDLSTTLATDTTATNDASS